MNITRISFLLSLVLSAISAGATVICGTVSDAESNEELIGASVKIDGTSIGAVTDIDGRYSINVKPGTYSITASYVGFSALTQSDIIASADTIVVDFALLIEQQTLGEVSVTAVARRNNQEHMQIEGGPTTIHGGTNDADNSGIYQYVRIEFAGYPFDTDKEINGLTLGSVGSGTTIDHIQVSYSNDDSFEWFGGSVNCNYLVAYKGWDDDFDTDNGFSGRVEYCLAVRDPRIADTSQSNSFESDNNAGGAETTPFTSALFSHVTLIGPMTAKNTDFVNSSDFITAGQLFPDNGSKLGKFQAALQIRRGSKLGASHLLAVGFPIGLIVDGEKGNTVKYAQNGKLTFDNILFAGMSIIGSDKNKLYEDHLYDFATGVEDPNQQSYSHTFFSSIPSNAIATEASLGLTDLAGVGQNYCPTTEISDGKGGYIGAFRNAADNWLAGWTNFDPQNTIY